MELKINGKTLIGIALLSTSLVLSNFVSVVDAESNGGVTVVNEQLPVGTVAMWGTSNPPTNWLEMNGQSTAGYSELASLYGSNLPDLRGQFVRGWDNGSGVDNGRSLLSNQVDQIQNITGIISAPGYVNTSVGYSLNGTGAFQPYGGLTSIDKIDGGADQGSIYRAVRFDASNVARAGAETRPVNVSLMYIVKAK